MSALRVMHLTTAAQPVAGAERLLIDIAHNGCRVGWEPSFVTIRPAGDLHRLAEAEGCRAWSLEVSSSRQAFSAWSSLRRLLREERPDVLHTHLHHAGVLGAAAAGGVPVVHSRHYSDYMQRFGSAWDRRLDSWAARRAGLVIAVSEAARDHLVEHEGVPPARIEIVPNGVDLDRIAALDRDKGRRVLAGLDLGDGPFVGCAASFHPRKGHAVLLRAFVDVARALPTARLVLLGEGPDRPACQEQAKALGLAGRVAFLGFHPLGHEVMSVLDCYVQPSIEEGFGLAVIEAMAMGRPVVASDVGGMRHTVVHGETGLRIPAGEAKELADAVVRVLSDQRLASRLGAAGRARADQRYSVRAMLAAYDACYRRVLAGSRS